LAISGGEDVTESCGDIALTAFAVEALLVFPILAAWHEHPEWPVAVSAVMLVAAIVAPMLLVRQALRASYRARCTADGLRRQLTATAATSGGWVFVISPDRRFVYSSDASRDCIG
jgi:hypothetical protein